MYGILPFSIYIIGSFLCSDFVLYSSSNLLLSKNKWVLVLVHVFFLQYRVLYRMCYFMDISYREIARQARKPNCIVVVGVLR